MGKYFCDTCKLYDDDVSIDPRNKIPFSFDVVVSLSLSLSLSLCLSLSLSLSQMIACKPYTSVSITAILD